MGLPPISSRFEIRHSPDGFQWGYSGSGPTELARAILLAVIPRDDRVRHPRCYRTFRDRFISRIKADEFTLDSKEVEEWYEEWVLTVSASEIERGWTKRGW